MPAPGVSIKLVPNEGKLEARVKAETVMPGYWRQPELTAKAFDEEGYYCLGDAFAYLDENEPQRGFRFDGRVSEDFKLDSGTWVSAGTLRAKFISAFAPFVQDVVLCGTNRGYISALIFPDWYSMFNGVVVSPSTSCLRISRAQTVSATADATIDEAGAPVFRSVVMQCGSPAFVGSNGVTEAQVSAVFGSGANNNNSAFTPSLTSLFINGATENAVTAFNASSIASYFDATTYIGAVRDANDTWYAGWTCNSSTANLGTSVTGLCTSLPTY